MYIAGHSLGGIMLETYIEVMVLVVIIELETKVIRRFAMISQSRRRPLLGPSSG